MPLLVDNGRVAATTFCRDARGVADAADDEDAVERIRY